MKYMKLGTKPDTFYTESATRTVISDVPTDIVIQIDNTKYLLHKFPLLLKCGLLQRLCSDPDDPSNSSAAARPLVLNDFPGGEPSFELCAKFCYSIAITLSAHNFLPTLSAARFLIMTDSVSRPNLLPKLHTFFLSFILPNWKDSVATLAAAASPPEFSDPTIIRPLMDSIVAKILTPPSEITWSFTYSRPPGRSVPKDWWTEDIANLGLDHFRSVISTVRSVKMLPPALIGEALHVYAIKNLPDPSEAAVSETLAKDRRVLEAIVSMIPGEIGAVSGGFLMRLLKIAVGLGGSPSVRAELVRRAGRQLDEVTVRDLQVGDLGVVEAVVESFLEGFRRQRGEKGDEIGRLRRVARLLDGFLGVIAREKGLGVEKFVELVEMLPEIAREEHDGLYQAINTFLEEHPDLSKAERKQLCHAIDCRKLSPPVRSHAITNERLPLRTLVQLLFVEQERVGGAGSSQGTPQLRPALEISNTREVHDQVRRSMQRPEEARHQHRTEQRREEARHQHIKEPTETSSAAKTVKKGDMSISMPKSKR